MPTSFLKDTFFRILLLVTRKPLNALLSKFFRRQTRTRVAVRSRTALTRNDTILTLCLQRHWCCPSRRSRHKHVLFLQYIIRAINIWRPLQGKFGTSLLHRELKPAVARRLHLERGKDEMDWMTSMMKCERKGNQMRSNVILHIKKLMLSKIPIESNEEDECQSAS